MKNVLYIPFKKRKFFYILLVLLAVSVLSAALETYDYLDEQHLEAAVNQPKVAPPGTVRMEIDISTRTLTLFSNDEPYKSYRIAVGKRSTPSPVGEWRVMWKDYNWGTGFGTRWMGLNVPWGIYGVHGTNKPWSIGRYASHGCIRMRNKDVEELFEWIPIGTLVKIIGPPVKVNRILQRGSSGPDVVMIQERLKNLGIYAQRTDGLFGESTEAAIKNFQQTCALPETGVVDEATKAKLGL